MKYTDVLKHEIWLPVSKRVRILGSELQAGRPARAGQEHKLVLFGRSKWKIEIEKQLHG